MINQKVKLSDQETHSEFEKLIKNNFAKLKNKSISRITVEVFIQLGIFWGLANLAIYVWRLCTGC